MQNQSLIKCKIEYCPIGLEDSFPVSYPGEEITPSTGQVSFMHYHNYIELGYCYKGCGIFFINDKIIPFSAGDASIIFPNEIHIAQSDKSNPSQWKFICIDPLKLLSGIELGELSILSTVINSNSPVRNIIPNGDEWFLNKAVYDLLNELEQRKKHYKSIIKSLAWSIFLKLSRMFSAETGEERRGYNQSISKIAPALMYISENYMKTIHLNDISGKCNLSVSHFRRLFSSAMNIPPSEYLYIVRIKMASILLINLDESILDISMKVGYSTLSSFNRHFRKIMGVTPKEWKKCGSI